MNFLAHTLALFDDISLTRIPSRYVRGFLYNVLKVSTAGGPPGFPQDFAAKSPDEKNCDYPKIGRKELRLRPNLRARVPPATDFAEKIINLNKNHKIINKNI